MAKKRLYAHVLLDQSGSMFGIKEQTIQGYNDYLKELKSDKNLSVRFSLTFFNTYGVDTVHNYQKKSEVKNLTDEDYNPNSMTPLYDAIGKVVADMKKQKTRKNEKRALVILTDGLENASVNFTGADIKEMLEELNKDENWLVLYLGANQDAILEGSKFGLQQDYSMTFDALNIGNTIKTSSASLQRYASSNKAEAAWTEEERKEVTS